MKNQLEFCMMQQKNGGSLEVMWNLWIKNRIQEIYGGLKARIRQGSGMGREERNKGR